MYVRLFPVALGALWLKGGAILQGRCFPGLPKEVLARLPASLVEVFYTVALNPLKPPQVYAVPSPCWAFCFKGEAWENPKVEINSKM